MKHFGSYIHHEIIRPIVKQEARDGVNKPLLHFAAHTINAVVSSLVFVAATSSCFAFDHPQTTDAEEERFVRLKKQGQEYYAAGKISEAIQYFKMAADTPHFPDFSALLGALIGVLSKAPTNPDGHIALGIYYMNLLDLRFRRDPNDAYLGEGREAEWEFKTAMSLSPNHKNSEAEALLTRLDNLRKAAQVHDSHSKWYADLKARKPFLGLLLTSRWNPPTHDGFLTTRLRTNWFSSEPVLVVESGSAGHDSSALNALRKCLQDFPYLYWGSRDFIFTSEGGSRTAEEECPGSVVIIDPLLSGKPQADEDTVARAFLERHFTMERIREYCKADTQYAYKCGVLQIQERPDVIIDGKLIGHSSEFGGPITWTCAAVAGKPVCYEVSIGFKWKIVVDPLKAPNEKDFDDFILLQRVRDALFSCLINYEVRHFSELPNEEWDSRQRSGDNAREELVRDNQGSVVAYKCALRDGRTVTAELNHDHSIVSVVVDGKPDQRWTEAYQQFLTNMQSCLGCGPIPIIPGRDVQRTKFKDDPQLK